MSITIKQRQYIGFSLLLVVTMAATVTAYHGTQQKFILFHQAEELTRAGAMEQGAALARQAIATGFDRSPAIIRLAEEYLAAGDLKAASALLGEMLSLHPEDGTLVDRFGLLLTHEGKEAEALALYNRYPQAWKKMPEAYFHLASLHQGRHEFEKAVALFRLGLTLDPENIAGRLQLAETLSWMQHYQEAIALYREVLAKQPNLRPARFALARVLAWNGMRDEAIREYRLALGDLP